MSVIKGITKGDTINLECDLDEDITNWKIRCEIYDECGSCIKLATANSGGSDSQIEITDSANGIFIIKVAKGLTKDFANRSKIEIEFENNNAEIITGFKGEILFDPQRIDWTTP